MKILSSGSWMGSRKPLYPVLAIKRVVTAGNENGAILLSIKLNIMDRIGEWSWFIVEDVSITGADGIEMLLSEVISVLFSFRWSIDNKEIRGGSWTISSRSKELIRLWLNSPFKSSREDGVVEGTVACFGADIF